MTISGLRSEASISYSKSGVGTKRQISQTLSEFTSITSQVVNESDGGEYYEK